MSTMFQKIVFGGSVIGGSIVAIPIANSATTPNSIVTPQTPNRGIVQFLQGTDTAGTYKTLYTAGANGSRCYAIVSTNTDTTAVHSLTVQVVNSTTKYGGANILTISNSGFTSTAEAQPMTTPAVWPGLPVDQYGNPYIQMISGDTLQATFGTALSTGTLINIYASCSDF